MFNVSFNVWRNTIIELCKLGLSGLEMVVEGNTTGTLSGAEQGTKCQQTSPLAAYSDGELSLKVTLQRGGSGIDC